MPHTALLAWASFAGCAGVIAVAGSVLCREADNIADTSGLPRGWIGLVMLATVTSLPELATGISSVAVAQAPDIAIGDALGSCVFNLGLLGIVYLMVPATSAVAGPPRLPAGLGIVLLAIVAIGLLQPPGPGLGSIGVYTPLILVAYAVGIRKLSALGHDPKVREQGAEAINPGLRRAMKRYCVAALFVVAAGSWLPFIARDISREMGWAESSVGLLFVALATSLPEVATTVAALRIRAVDMAVGNLLGSNMFDVLIIALDDVLFVRGPILSFVSRDHLVPALVAIAMSALAMARPTRRIGAALLGLYLASAIFSFGPAS